MSGSDLGPDFAAQMCERPQQHVDAMAARGECPWCGLIDQRQIREAVAVEVVWKQRRVPVKDRCGRTILVKLVYDAKVVAPPSDADRKSRSRLRMLPFQIGCGLIVPGVVTGAVAWLAAAGIAFVAGIAAMVLVRNGRSEWDRRLVEDIALKGWMSRHRFGQGTKSSVTVQALGGGKFKFLSKEAADAEQEAADAAHAEFVKAVKKFNRG